MRQFHVLLHSKYSPSSVKFLTMLSSINLNFDISLICIDNKQIRERILKNKEIDIKSVPCLLLISDTSRIDKYEGVDCFEWLQFYINASKPIVEEIPKNTQIISPITPQPTQPSSTKTNISKISDLEDTEEDLDTITNHVEIEQSSFGDNIPFEGDFGEISENNIGDSSNNEEEETGNDVYSQMQAHFKSQIKFQKAKADKSSEPIKNLIDTSSSKKQQSSNKKKTDLLAAALEMAKSREIEESGNSKIPPHLRNI